MSIMKSWFLNKEYPRKLIENEMRKVKFSEEQIKTAEEAKGVPFFCDIQSPIEIPW